MTGQERRVSGIEDVRTDLAEFRGEMSATFQAFSAQVLKVLDDHEARLRAQEARACITNGEARMQAVEQTNASLTQSTITWPKLITAMIAAGTLMAWLFPILSDAFQHIERP